MDNRLFHGERERERKSERGKERARERERETGQRYSYTHILNVQSAFSVSLNDTEYPLDRLEGVLREYVIQ